MTVPPPSATVPPASPQPDGGIVILSTAQRPDFSRLTATAGPTQVAALLPPGVSEGAQLPPGVAQVPQGAPVSVPPEVAAAAVPPPVNTAFEGDQFLQDGAVEVAVPVGWQAWWQTGTVQCALYELLNTGGYCPNQTYYRPEFEVVNPATMIRGERVLDGSQSVRFFCTYGVCIGGLFQQARVVPGARYVFGGYAFSWCSTDPEFHQDVLHSTLETRDDQLNCEVALGLDPAGGTDWRSPSVQWVAMSAYDTYTYFETPLVTATGPTMTLFIRGRSLWGFHHIDFHFDGLSFAPR
jgi:hypothetical protein